MKYFIIFIFLKLFIVSSYPDFTIKKEEESIIIQEVYIDRRDNVSDKMISLEDDYFRKFKDIDLKGIGLSVNFGIRSNKFNPGSNNFFDKFRFFRSFFDKITIRLENNEEKKKCSLSFTKGISTYHHLFNLTKFLKDNDYTDHEYRSFGLSIEIPDDYELNDCLDIMESNLFLHKISTTNLGSKGNFVFDVMKKYHMFLYNQRNNLEFNNKLIELNNEFETSKDKIREDNEIFMKELEERYILESEKIKDFNKKICYYFLPFIVILSLFLIYISTYDKKKENIDIIFFNKMISKNREKIEDIYIKNENYIKIIEKYKKDNEYKNKIIKKLLTKF